jgi:threonylcarbamoyladenosine tRNA methylthiotransferase MtaB
MAVDIVTFGCRLNTYESEVMRREAEAAGLGELAHGAIIFNTCAVTGEAVRQAKQSIRRARRENPGARIIVTGCAAQTETDVFVAMDEVDLVLGNEEKLKAHSYRALPDFGVNLFEKARRQRHNVGQGDRIAFGRRNRRARPRFCSGAERL